MSIRSYLYVSQIKLVDFIFLSETSRFLVYAAPKKTFLIDPLVFLALFH